jgi:predicted lipoprotein with Yx(FWY)xxD motif
MRTRWFVTLLLLVVVSACGNSGADPQDEAVSEPTAAATDPDDAASRDEATPSPTSRPGATGTRIVVSGSEFGPMLFDATGQAIYLFDVETTSEPECYGACAEAWPPVLTRKAPVAGEGVERSLLGTTQRTDGTTQVTYNGHPLYFYAHEGKREVKCHDIFLNGGNWYVVQPGGDAAPPG